jgi:hypothetical protein
MLRRYLIGAWLWAHDYNLYELPGAYFRTKSFAENLEEGRVPDCALLSRARAPMVALATGVVLLLYLFVRVLGDLLAGAAAATTVGLGTLIVRAVRGRGTAGRLPAEGLLVLTLLVYVVGISAGLGLAWQPYLVPTCLLAILLSALGLAVLARHLVARTKPWRGAPVTGYLTARNGRAGLRR